MQYEHLCTNSRKWHLFQHFKPINGYFSVVILKETYILLELPFYSASNALGPNIIY